MITKIYLLHHYRYCISIYFLATGTIPINSCNVVESSNLRASISAFMAAMAGDMSGSFLMASKKNEDISESTIKIGQKLMAVMIRFTLQAFLIVI